MVIVLVMDFVIYYPFFKVYDNQKLEEEKNNHFEVKEDDSVEVDGKVLDSKKFLYYVLVVEQAVYLPMPLLKVLKKKEFH